MKNVLISNLKHLKLGQGVRSCGTLPYTLLDYHYYNGYHIILLILDLNMETICEVCASGSLASEKMFNIKDSERFKKRTCKVEIKHICDKDYINFNLCYSTNQVNSCDPSGKH